MPENPRPTAVGMTPQEIANFLPQMSEYLKQLLSGQFLDQGNPYIRDLLASIEADSERAYRTSTVPLMRSSLNMSGAYGSALGSLAESAASQDYTRALMGQLANTRTGLYESERDRMVQGLGMYSQETLGSRGLLGNMRDADLSSWTNIRQSSMAAAAQRFAASQASSAARYGANRSYALGMEQLRYSYLRDLLNQSQNWNNFRGGPPNMPSPDGPGFRGGPWGGFPYRPPLDDIGAGKPGGGNFW